MFGKQIWEGLIKMFKTEDIVKNFRLFDGDVHFHFHIYLGKFDENKKKETKGGIV